ncbi:class I SAM-dependent methyltransferase [Rhodoferax ferrireducens]|uniref:class I SAM-dependent methyltransferase n=1 Tax=Rhodoferax ferrireducens TaxID=192843 RepID=UPI003BB5B44A
MDLLSAATAHGLGSASSWVQRWSHLVARHGSVLDIACGQGRHMQWFAEQGHAVTGIDRSPDAIRAASRMGEAVLADIENAPWPLMHRGHARQFDAVIVTNYLWRPLFGVITQSVAPGGVLIYETFAQGHETVGKPSNPDFLLRPNELLTAFKSLHIVAFEDGFLDHPPRFVQRIAVVQPDLGEGTRQTPARYTL